jgi:hypothetical protein
MLSKRAMRDSRFEVSVLFLERIFLVGLALFPSSALAEQNESELDVRSQSNVFIFRTTSYAKLAKVSVKIDGIKFVSLPNKSYTQIYLSSGMHQISTSGSILFGISAVNFSANIENGKQYYIEINGDYDLIYRAVKMTTSIDFIDPQIAGRYFGKYKLVKPVK